VVIAGFQAVGAEPDIVTLGRDGSRPALGK
jgi:aspartokinase